MAEPWIGKGGDGGAEQGTAQGSPLASTQGARSARGGAEATPLAATPGAELDAAQVAEQDATQGAEQDRLLPEFPGPSAGRSWNWYGPTPTRRRNGGTRRYWKNANGPANETLTGKQRRQKGEGDAAGAPGARHGQLGPLLRRRALKWRRQRHADEIRKRGPRGVPRSCGGARV